MVFYERRLEHESTESKINEFDFDFVEELKMDEFSKNVKSEITKNKLKIT